MVSAPADAVMSTGAPGAITAPPNESATADAVLALIVTAWELSAR